MQQIDEKTIMHLLQRADEAKEQAYAPYSDFRVGACLLDDKGNEYLGCNVENAAYGCAICAERTAVTKAVSEGSRSFTAIAITADSEDAAYPCGICRQVLTEFSPDMVVIASNNGFSQYSVHTAAELLPHAFSAKDL